MKLKNVFMMFLVAIVAITFSNGVMAANKKKQMTEKEMMEMWMKLATPGEMHKHFEYFVGEWDMTTTMWEPGKEAQVSKGTTKNKLILGGRYLVSRMKGSYAGMPFAGFSVSGYDNYRKTFNTFWIDNFGTGFYFTTGKLSENGKVMTETGNWDDFTTGHPMKVRNVTTIINENEMKFEMFHTQYGKKEIKAMEILYKRKKK